MLPMIFAAGRNPPFSPAPARIFLACAVFRLRPMRLRFAATFARRPDRRSLLVAAGAGAAMIGIYRNGMETHGPARPADQALRLQLRPRRLRRGAADRGRQGAPTPAPTGPRCSAATSRSPPPSACSAAPRRRCSARPTWPSSCAPAPAPSTSCWSSRCSARCSWSRSPPTGTEYLAIQKNVKDLMGVNKANALRLRVLKPAKGQAQLSAYVGGDPRHRSDRRSRRRPHRGRLGRRRRRDQRRQRRHRQRRRRRRPRPGRLRRAQLGLGAARGANGFRGGGPIGPRLGPIPVGVLRTRRRRGREGDLFVHHGRDQAGVEAGAGRGQVDAVPEQVFVGGRDRRPVDQRSCAASRRPLRRARGWTRPIQLTGAWSSIRKSSPTSEVALRSASISSL